MDFACSLTFWPVELKKLLFDLRLKYHISEMWHELQTLWALLINDEKSAKFKTA